MSVHQQILPQPHQQVTSQLTSTFQTGLQQLPTSMQSGIQHLPPGISQLQHQQQLPPPPGHQVQQQQITQQLAPTGVVAPASWGPSASSFQPVYAVSQGQPPASYSHFQPHQVCWIYLCFDFQIIFMPLH